MLAVELAELAVKAVETPQVSRLGIEAADLLRQVAPTAVKRLADGANTVINWLEKAKLVDNPYLREFEATQINPAYKRAREILCDKEAPDDALIPAYHEHSDARFALTHKYAWAVPNAEALATIAEQGKVVEAGAGSGYWSSLLRKMDVDVVAFDQHGTDLLSNAYHKNGVEAWTDIVKGNAQSVSVHGDRALFMSWPPANTTFAHDVLNHYSGDKFVYVGHAGDGEGINGEKRFFNLLAKKWKEVKTVQIPRWQFDNRDMEDAMQVFERR